MALVTEKRHWDTLGKAEGAYQAVAWRAVPVGGARLYGDPW